MNKIKIWMAHALVVVLVLSFSACGGSGDQTNNAGATLVSLAVTPTNPNIAKGTTKQFAATSTYSDNTTTDLTASVSWHSSDAAMATIASTGLATGVGAGSATITATLGSVSGTTTLTVTAATLASISITPANSSIAKGTTKQFSVTGTFSDNTTQDLTATVTWSSSDTAKATITSSGLATGVGVGSATITATSSGISGTTTLFVTNATLVSIEVTPTNPSIAKGTTKQFAATGTFTDNTTQDLTSSVTWNSSDTAKAAINSSGLATGAGVGSATITATSGTVSGTTTLSVTAATLVTIAVAPASSSIALGLTKQFTATGTYTDSTTQNITTSMTWTSSNVGVAAISNANGSQGLATSVSIGSATITALDPATNISGTAAFAVTNAALAFIAITPANPSITAGTTQQFTATGTYSDNTTLNLTSSVSWQSSNTAKATITSTGLATGTGVGSATITATSGGVSGTTTLTINPSGSIDTSFGSAGTGIVTTTFGNWDCGANALAIQSDGKIVTVGYSGNGNNDDFAIVRYNTDGSFDTTFNGSGGTTTPIGASGDRANAVAIQSDGKIVVAGYTWDSNTGYKIALVRYNANGSLDTGFNGTGKVSTAIGNEARATAVAIQSDGKIIVAGYTLSGGYYNFALVRYNTGGSLDTSFGASGIVTTSICTYNDYAYAVGIQGDGKIIATGYAYNSGTGGDEFALARYNTDGTLDTSFGASGKVTTMISSIYDRAYAMAIQGDGKIVAAGASGSQFALARYNANGTLDNTFNGTGVTMAGVGFISGTVYSLAIQSDGKIVAAGSDGSYYFGLVRYNTNGAIDTLFGSFGASGGISTYMGVTNGAAAVAIQGDGKIVAAGSSTVAGHFNSYGFLVTDFGLARYLP